MIHCSETDRRSWNRKLCTMRSCGQAMGVLKSEEYRQSCQPELEEVREKSVSLEIQESLPYHTKGNNEQAQDGGKRETKQDCLGKTGKGAGRGKGEAGEGKRIQQKETEILNRAMKHKQNYQEMDGGRQDKDRMVGRGY